MSWPVPMFAANRDTLIRASGKQKEKKGVGRYYYNRRKLITPGSEEAKTMYMVFIDTFQL